MYNLGKNGQIISAKSSDNDEVLFFLNTHKINLSLQCNHSMSLIRIELKNTVAKSFVKRRQAPDKI